MKRILSTMLLAALLMLPLGAQNGTFTIQGKVGKVNDGAVVEALLWLGNTGHTVASDTISNGRFTLSIPTDEPQNYSVNVYGDDYPNFHILRVWGEPGKTVKITGKGKMSWLWKIFSNNKEQKEYDRYRRASEKQHHELIFTDLEREKYEREKYEQLTKEEKKKFSRYKDSLGLRIDSLYSVVALNNIRIMRQTPPSEIWMDMLDGSVRNIDYFSEFCAGNRGALADLYNTLDDGWKAHPKAKQARVMLYPPEKVGVGDMFADAQMKDLEGNVHMLSEYLGTYILLDFWSAGCGPCIMAMPELRELTAKYAGRLTIVGINTDGDTVAWRRVSEREDITWVNLGVDIGSGVPEQYGVRGYPSQVVISPDGVIVESWSGFGRGLTERKLRKYLDK